MKRRRHGLTKKRIICTIVCGDQRYSGVVLDCSPQGLFVQCDLWCVRGCMGGESCRSRRVST